MKNAVCLWLFLIPLAGADLLEAAQARIQGSLECSNCPAGATVTVEILDVIQHTVIDKAYVLSNGDFELRETPEGLHEIRVVAQDGSVLKTQTSSLNPFVPLRVELTLPQRTESGSGTISIARLRHKISGKALKQFRKAEQRTAVGDLEGAVQLLQAAIAIDPDYMEAHNNLGVRYMSMGKADLAIPAFRRAAELDPGIGMTYSNLAIALITAGKAGEAEAPARRGVELDRASAKVRYVFAMSLIAQGKSMGEALEILKAVGAEFPEARLTAARLLIASGENEAARALLNGYIASGRHAKRSEVQAWLSSLK